MGDWLPPLILACFSPPIEVGVISHLIYYVLNIVLILDFERKRTCMELKVSKDDIIQKLKEKLNISDKQAAGVLYDICKIRSVG